MGLTSSHRSSEVKERKPRAGKINGKVITNIEPYSKVEHIIDQIYCDIMNGVSRYHIKRKLMEGNYEGQEKGFSERHTYDYLTAANERIKNDFAMGQEEARNLLLGRLESVYNDAFVLGDKNAAIRALENMAKMYGLDKPQTAIQINTDSSNGVTINFGFPNKEENDETE